MIFVYPFLELTGVNKHLSIKLRETGTVFQLIWNKHISYLLLIQAEIFLKRFWLILNFDISISYRF